MFSDKLTKNDSFTFTFDLDRFPQLFVDLHYLHLSSSFSAMQQVQHACCYMSFPLHFVDI